MVDPDAVPGQYAIPITGNGGGIEDSVTLSLNIVASDSGNASISGNLKTENHLADFTVPVLSNGSSSILQVTALVEEQDDFVKGQLLVQYRSDDLRGLSTQEEKERYEVRALEVQSTFGLQTLQAGGPKVPHLVKVNEHKNLLVLAKEISTHPDVKFAEPNSIISRMSLPNDAKLHQQWQLAAAGLPVAWEVRKTTTKNNCCA